VIILTSSAVNSQSVIQVKVKGKYMHLEDPLVSQSTLRLKEVISVGLLVIGLPPAITGHHRQSFEAGAFSRALKGLT
jgi:hypothetical protein